MSSRVCPELPTAPVGSSQAPTAAVDNSAPYTIRSGSSYISGFTVQTNGATSTRGGAPRSTLPWHASGIADNAGCGRSDRRSVSHDTPCRIRPARPARPCDKTRWRARPWPVPRTRHVSRDRPGRRWRAPRPAPQGKPRTFRAEGWKSRAVPAVRWCRSGGFAPGGSSAWWY